jgi:serine/threonine-protein kinase HipA
MPIPPWARIRELQYAAKMFENEKDPDISNDWLNILIAPGSSLGGARPKANLLSEDGQLWIAKFPSKADEIDKAQWEFLAYKLALNAGINMSESKLEHISDRYNTFFTKRFDRRSQQRIHFASGMTMTGNSEESLRDSPGSYLDLVDFIDRNGAQPDLDLEQLWRRMIFNILISNTDDHLRNHGFLLSEKGWILSPAFDINPSVDKKGLALNIDMTNNDLEIELALGVGEYFRLNRTQMDHILKEVIKAVKNWEQVANSIGISRKEQQLMRDAFTA